jgi:putative ABC transport system ATP-binding protein
MIKLKNIQKLYRTDSVETVALDCINLEIETGDFLAIMGPSGCGKTTLLNILGLIDDPSSGEVIVDNTVVQHLSDRRVSRLRNQKIGFIYQSFHLINDLTILENVELPLLYAHVSSKERQRAATEALARVGLEHRLHHYPRQLSGGQRQRAAIARAIVGKPSLILADEPTGNLDSRMGAEIMDLLEELNNENRMTLVMVTHDKLMAQRAHKIVRLQDGVLIEN